MTIDDPTTSTILRHVAGLGYVVTVRQEPGQVVMRAVDHSQHPSAEHVARMGDCEPYAEYRCACLLAEMVGVELEDG